MRRTVDYYFAPQSPWMYLGHARFTDIVRRTGAAVNVRPVDYGQIFAVSGGLPLPKRAPQRQAYRLVELRRFSEALGIPLNPQPRHFPVAGDPAGLLITTVADLDGADAAMRLTAAVARAIWAEERDAADETTLAQRSDGGLGVGHQFLEALTDHLCEDVRVFADDDPDIGKGLSRILHSRNAENCHDLPSV